MLQFYWDFKDSEVRQFSCRTQSWDSGTECCKSTGISKTVECGSSYTELRAGGERTCGLCANSRRKGVWKSGFQFAVCAVTLQSGCHVYRSLLTYPQWICGMQSLLTCPQWICGMWSTGMSDCFFEVSKVYFHKPSG